MALPPGVTGKTLTFGRGSFPDGTAVSGRVTITATKNFKHIPSGRPLYKGPMTRTFEDGVATFEELVPNDAPGLDRYDWTFHVAFQLNGVTEQPESYDFAIFVADPSTIDGDTLTPVPSSIGIPVSVNALRIPPGGTIGQALVLGSDFGVTWGTFQQAGDFATNTALSTGLQTKVNSSTYTAGLATKADLSTLGATVAADATVRAAFESVSPLKYGAAGDGVTDDSAAFSAMTLALPAGSVVNLGGRTYKLGSTWNCNKTVKIIDGALLGSARRILLLNAADIAVENVTISRTGTTIASSNDDGSAIFAQYPFSVRGCRISNEAGHAIAGKAASVNGSTIRDNQLTISRALQDVSAVLINAEPAGVPNDRITVRDNVVQCNGNPHGISIYNATNCRVRNNRIDGPSVLPTVTLTGWTLLSGTTWTTADRTDGNTRVVSVSGTQYPEAIQNAHTATAPSSGEWGIASGTVYLNLGGTDPNTVTVTSQINAGYGVMLYSNGITVQSGNLVEGNDISNTGGIGIYFQNGGQSGAVDNISRNNRLTNVCTGGSQSQYLAFAGISFSQGNNCQSVNDVIIGVGAVGKAVPGIRLNANSDTATMSAKIVGTTVRGSYGAGIQLCPGDIDLASLTLVGNTQAGITIGQTASGVVGNIAIVDCNSSNNGGDGIALTVVAGTLTKFTVIGGTLQGNTGRGITGSAVRGLKVLGTHIAGNAIAGIRVANAAQRLVFDNLTSGFQTSFLLSVSSDSTDVYVGKVDSGGNTTPFDLPLTVTTGGGSGSGFAQDFSGNGAPEAVVTARPGSTFRRRDGAAGSTFYVKQTGTGNTGWLAVA